MVRRRAPTRAFPAGAIEATAKPGSAGWMPSTRWTRSRVGVDDQPWLTVPPAHVSVHEVEHRFVAQRCEPSEYVRARVRQRFRQHSCPAGHIEHVSA